jgi:hypothetical protein
MIRRAMTHTPTRRPGISLMEVLVGFGILAIGVTSVMTLFPFSALTIGGALRDDRTTTCAQTADGYLRDYYARNVVEVELGTLTTPPTASTELFWLKLDNPTYFPTATPPSTVPLPFPSPFPSPPTPIPAPNPNEPSYPVALDPMGYVARSGRLDQNWIGDSLTGTAPSNLTGVPRAQLNSVPSGVTGNQLALRLCSQMDALSYDDGGAVSSTSGDIRELRYNWMWVLQRPVESDRYTLRMQVVVYDRRVHLYAPAKAEAVFTGVTFTPGETAILNVPNTAELRKGTWVMDATIGSTTDPFDNVTRPLRHAEFYRVLSVTDLGTGFLALEVHKPVTRPDGMVYLPNTAKFQYTGTLVVLPAVADVFERPQLSASYTP